MTITVDTELNNLLIGGNFNTNPWQRGTIFVSPVSGDYTADQFQYRVSGSQDFTVSRSTDKPLFSESGLFSTLSLDATVTTANASPGTSDFTSIEQPIEGYRVESIFNRQFGITFWVKSSVAGTYCVAFQNAARTRNYIQEYTIVSPDTWEQFGFSLFQDASVGVWETTNLTGFRVIFTLNAGSALQGAPDAWQAGNLIATSNQVNLSATLTNSFKVALIQFTSTIAKDRFYLTDRTTELMYAQRYYQKSYNVNDDPETITESGVAGTTAQGSDMLTGLSENIATAMRAVPVVTWYSPATGAIDNIRNVEDSTEVPITSTTGTGENNTGYPVSTSSVANGKVLEAHYTLDASLT